MPEARDQWGPFRLLARVGAGGFGEVYRAWDPNLEREVALKLLLPGAVGGDEEYKAMLREARAMASVQHENIVHVYGIDRHDGRVGFWTDFVKGKTLSALLGSQGPFGYREAALIGIDVSRALAAVHRAGLLHRDIKAENVMREEGGRMLLMDFGLSAGERTVMTQLAGTPNYMAPELFDGGKATVCTDIYAMGVLLYYLVIGDYPARLTGLSINEAKIALGRRTPLMDLRSDLPEPFLRTVRIAMELDPAKRFASAGQLAEG
ncbi:MAG TPA: serine/threonine-protein kinase, partial [Acidobacteriaceae bacterium]|nr:serine/threonine-protein kinase [Acidobacteriaceae bacterium]